MVGALLTASLGSCNPFTSEFRLLQTGRLVVWHPFEGREGDAFEKILSKYMQLYPDRRIVVERFTEEELIVNFQKQARSGLGPTLVIANENPTLSQLIEHNLIKSLSAGEVNARIFSPDTLGEVRLGDSYYGIPFSSVTQVLCYNRQRVAKAPETLTELSDEVRAGKKLGIVSDFVSTLWGVGAFGNGIFNDRGQILLAQSGWAAWLDWLKGARAHPNVILNSDIAKLQDSFADEQLDYYVCKSWEIPILRDQLGRKNLGISLLPGNEDRHATPVTNTRAIAYNRAVAEREFKLGLELGQYLTNVEQQIQFAIATESQIPSNKNAKIDPRLSPLEAILLEQVKFSKPIPLEFIFTSDNNIQQALDTGNLYYNRVLEGEISPQQAAEELSEQLRALLKR
ncbi:MAG: extracellular solute-binding protein [Cyanobacteria bacterium P01_H01_bin.15]